MPYTKVHKHLLQSMLGQGVILVSDAEEIIKSVDEESEYDDISEVVRDINREIQPFKQNLKIVTDETTEERCIVFLSLALDAATKSSNIFHSHELEYFRVLLENIVMSSQRKLNLAAALNLTPTGKITKTDALNLLTKWCSMRYLEKTENFYSLGIRAIHEFEAYLRRNIPDCIEECTLCKQVVFQGCNCPTCNAAIHTRCLNKYLEKVEKWPCCKFEYTGIPDHDISDERLQQSTSRNELEQSATEAINHTQQSTAIDQSQEAMSESEAPVITQCVADRRKKRRRE